MGTDVYSVWRRRFFNAVYINIRFSFFSDFFLMRNDVRTNECATAMYPYLICAQFYFCFFVYAVPFNAMNIEIFNDRSVPHTQRSSKRRPIRLNLNFPSQRVATISIRCILRNKTKKKPIPLFSHLIMGFSIFNRITVQNCQCFFCVH